MRHSSEPIFNLPPVIVFTIAGLAIVHVLHTLVFSDEMDAWFVLTFAFDPARYAAGPLAEALPGGFGAKIWTFVTYALIHADLMHIGFNVLWLLPFGSAVARRFGATRFLLFFALTAAGGAVAHLLTHVGEQMPMIGASAAISGMMAASIRFVFQRGGPFAIMRGDDGYRVPALSLLAALRDLRVLAFLAAWFGTNLLFGLGSFSLAGQHATAWQAHVGGFLAGLLLFGWFDPISATPKPDGDRKPTLH